MIGTPFNNGGSTDNEAVKIVTALKPFVKNWFEEWGQSCVRSKKMTVSTAPTNGLIGVKDAFSDKELFIRYMSSCANAAVGDTVWCKWMFDNMQTLYADSMGDLTSSAPYVPASGGTFTGDVSFQGNETVNGVIDVTSRRSSATLSSVGWYRVMSFQAGTDAQAHGSTGLVIRFNIVRRGSSVDAESHSVTFRSINADLGGFECENSKSYSLLIDKIRQTVDGTTVYFDIHYTGSAENLTTCYFDCYVWPDLQKRIFSDGLTPVSDAPVGETVVMTYDFSANIQNITLNYYDESSPSNYTIGSNNYVAVQYPQSIRGKKIVSIALISWTSNSGAFTILPYGDNAGTNWYIIGNSGTTINGARFRYWYI